MKGNKNKILVWVAQILERRYGPKQQSPRGKPLNVLIGTILSQNTTSLNSRRAYEAMQTAFPTWEGVMDAPRTRLQRVLRPAGLARTRSARIQSILRTIASHGPLDLDYLRHLPDEEAERRLLEFDGVGYKTARCVLLFALGRDVFPVDTHIHRVLTRLGVLPKGVTPDKAHKDLEPLIPKGRSYALHLNLIALGRDICHPRDPDCTSCPLGPCCDYFRS